MNLQKEREKAGYSQSELANKLGIATSTYCQYETGKRNIPYEIVEKINEILDISKENKIFLPTKFTVSK